MVQLGLNVRLYEDTVLAHVLTQAQTLAQTRLTETLSERALTVSLTDVLTGA